MTSVQEHYDRHLGPVYTWMAGGVDAAIERGRSELDAIGLKPPGHGLAVDLGAGFGMHSIPLAQQGFDVLAIDSCAMLLEELRTQGNGLSIQTVQDDLQSYPRHLSGKPDLVLCMGDTLTHLPDEASVARLIATVSANIIAGGRFVATLRDYSTPLTGEQRFILVRSDAHRVLTCFLEYSDAHVAVHDILHQRDGADWSLSVSKYDKVRLSPQWLDDTLRDNGFAVGRHAGPSGMIRIVAERV